MKVADTAFDSPYIIEMKSVTKVFDGETVIDKMNLNIKKGEFVTILDHPAVVSPLL